MQASHPLYLSFSKDTLDRQGASLLLMHYYLLFLYLPIQIFSYSIKSNMLFLVHIIKRDGTIIPCITEYVNAFRYLSLSSFSSFLPTRLKHPLRKDSLQWLFRKL